jgi:hypothetical protein
MVGVFDIIIDATKVIFEDGNYPTQNSITLRRYNLNCL